VKNGNAGESGIPFYKGEPVSPEESILIHLGSLHSIKRLTSLQEERKVSFFLRGRSTYPLQYHLPQRYLVTREKGGSKGS